MVIYAELLKNLNLIIASIIINFCYFIIIIIFNGDGVFYLNEIFKWCSDKLP